MLGTVTVATLHTVKTLGLLQSHLGCLSCIGMTFIQEMPPKMFSLKSIEELLVKSVSFSEDLFGYIPGILR